MAKKSSLTPFGKELSKLRIDHDEDLQDMARRLSMSTSGLRNIVSGRSNVPDGLVDKIVSVYELGAAEASKLADSIIRSITKIEFDLTTLLEHERNAVMDLFERLYAGHSDAGDSASAGQDDTTYDGDAANGSSAEAA